MSDDPSRPPPFRSFYLQELVEVKLGVLWAWLGPGSAGHPYLRNARGLACSLNVYMAMGVPNGESRRCFGGGLWVPCERVTSPLS